MADKARRLGEDMYVHVGGRVFGPGDEVPAELQGEIRNEAVWAQDAAVAETPAAEPAAPTSGVADAPDTPKPTVPPRGGPGSGRDVWVKYAEANGVEVTDDMRSRDDVIAAVELAGVPAE